MGKHALVFGATGIQGWAVVNQLLHGYPSSDTFEKVTALTNRPPTENLLWPQSEKLQVVSGIDLLNERGQEALEQQMREKIQDVHTVTQVFFFAYIFNADPTEETKINVKLLQRAVLAVENLSKSLEFIVLPTGTKVYGVHLCSDFPFADKLPLREDLPRTPEPDRSQNFYYHLCDWLESQAANKAWTWCELRPDVVVGFVPNNNVYCLAQTLALYLSLFRELEGKGAECAFPGNERSWEILSSDSPQDLVAEFAIYASLHADVCGAGKAFNTAGRAKPASWSEKWPAICEYFGLKGTPPPPSGSSIQSPGDYLNAHIEQWKELERKQSLATGRVGNDRSLAGYLYFIMSMFDFDRHLDLTRQNQVLKQAGPVEEWDPKRAWWTAFDRFRAAKIIP
ncbi:hypothetical protein BDY17DRAFT_246860 [Neohortaea acidophila]|uniref:PRISE-like Rossmann-fold domain-containing protein n=1 Tax=Neohortaea acidophila TaxID=245834 RepID=A0A6A6PZJ5_9PEZI|nr:uncharacterized protein BDY17DRAFT_246860 [Neohortaea acidophila]KAF2485174.1 hypothetical protein BDY17DRAFT_246860 [Neohortaea acidophila]